MHPNLTPKQIDHFWAKVDRSGGYDACWPWMGYRSDDGYGSFHAIKSGCTRRAHRIAFFLANGRWPNPDGLHSCDNPPCCNPAHIFEGTQIDNMADMTAKNRRANGALTSHHKMRGEAHGMARLTAEQVAEIRHRYANGDITQHELANDFGVRRSHISRIVNGVRW